MTCSWISLLHLELCFWPDDDYLAFIQQVFIEHLLYARHNFSPGDIAENEISSVSHFIGLAF